jgi:predicted DNA-binding ribbon-helix-helix protein
LDDLDLSVYVQPDFFLTLQLFGLGCLAEKVRASMKSQIVKRSIVIAGRKQSISLEEPVWRSLKEIATHRDITLQDLLTKIASGEYQGKISSAVRLFILNFYRAQLDLQHRHDVVVAVIRSPILALH